MNVIPDFSTVELGDSPAPDDLDAWALLKTILKITKNTNISNVSKIIKGKK